MAVRPVHWYEGMFLRPQQLQAAERFRHHAAAHGDKWDCHYNWGLRSIVIDGDALANYRFVIRSLQVRKCAMVPSSIFPRPTLLPTWT